MPVSELFPIAAGFEQSGKLEEADRLLNRILAVAPNQPDTLHMSGIVAFRLGRQQMVAISPALMSNPKLLLNIFSADTQAIPAREFSIAVAPLAGGIVIGLYPLVVMATVIAVIAGLQALLAYTELGRAFRATSDDQATAQLMGIDNKQLYGIAMASAMGIVGLAGLYLGMRANFDPGAGPSRLLYAFEAVVIGGLGSLWGTLAGGMILGVSQAVGARLDPGWGILASHLAFLPVLVVKPNGLFPRMRDR